MKNYINESNFSKNITLAKFLADSDATKHLTNSKLVFKAFDKNKRGFIKCANKESQADLESEGAGTVNVKLNNYETMSLENVICTSALSENLLSLRKFADMGLGIYLDNEKIDIFDPISHESFISRIYQKPYWIIELELDKTRDECEMSNESKRTKTIAYLTIEINDNEPRYMTRSKTKITDKSQSNEQIGLTDSASRKNDEKEIGSEVSELKTRERNNESKTERESSNLIIKNSNFDITIWD